MIRKLAVTAVLAIALSGCSGLNSTNTGDIGTSSGVGATSVFDPLITVLTRINNGGIDGLTRVIAIASVPNPDLPGSIEDAHGLTCAQAGMKVLLQIQALNAAGKGTAASGVTSNLAVDAEMASLFKPGSPQFNSARDTLAAGCLAKANDVLGPAAVIAAGGVIGAMTLAPQILPLAAGAENYRFAPVTFSM